MAERRQLRTSEGLEGHSECPATGHGHPDPRWTSAFPSQNQRYNTSHLRQPILCRTGLPSMALARECGRTIVHLGTTRKRRGFSGLSVASSCGGRLFPQSAGDLFSGRLAGCVHAVSLAPFEEVPVPRWVVENIARCFGTRVTITTREAAKAFCEGPFLQFINRVLHFFHRQDVNPALGINTALSPRTAC